MHVLRVTGNIHGITNLVKAPETFVPVRVNGLLDVTHRLLFFAQENAVDENSVCVESLNTYDGRGKHTDLPKT